METRDPRISFSFSLTAEEKTRCWVLHTHTTEGRHLHPLKAEVRLCTPQDRVGREILQSQPHDLPEVRPQDRDPETQKGKARASNPLLWSRQGLHCGLNC